MKKFLIVNIILFLLAFNNSSFAQILKVVKWHWTVERVNDNEYDLIFKAGIKPGWSLYSQHIEGQGPVPTSFHFDKGDHYKLIGETKESDNVETVQDKVFGIQIKKFHDYATFTQRVKVLDKSKPITGYITFMSCDDTHCLPPSDVDFKFDIKKWDKTFDFFDPDKKAANKTKVKSVPVKNKGEKVGLKKKNKEEQTPKSKEKTNKVKLSQDKEDSKTEIAPAPLQIDNNAGAMQNEKGKNKQESPVKWSFEIKKIDDSTAILRYIANIKEGWDVYSMYTEDNGPVPTSITYEEKDGITLLGKPVESGNLKEGMDPVFGVKVKQFLWHKPYIIEQKIRIKDKSKPVKGYIGYQACDDERCIFLEKNFAFDLQKGVAIDEDNATQDKAGSVAAGKINPDNPVTKYSFDKSQINEDCSEEVAASGEEESSNWWMIFLAGFVGGLLAFLTPCVFPMVPLTVSFFTKHSGSRAKGIRNAIYYGLSIIVIYVIMGLAVTGIFGADALNQLSTNAWFNIFFAILFIVFAISFFGYFEITLPSSWANKSDSMANKGGLIGIFFMAFTLALVSFSCTGPIIGTLLVQTATGGGPTIFGSIPAGPLFGMLGFSTALALPFALFAMFPAWLNSLPKSGSWMNVIKVTLGFIEIALALKFISIADLTMGWKILPYELFVALWILIALAMAAYYFGLIRFPLDPPKQKISLARKILGVFMIGFAIYFASGFMTSKKSGTFVTPNMLSGLAPPAGHSYIHAKHCPLNINCFHDFDEGLEYAKKVNKPILLDFTGWGCVNCRRMEDNVWSKDEILNLIKDKYVLISLYVDERKPLDKPYISDFSNRKMRTVGNKWADFQAVHFNKNSQPYYVLMSPDGKVLNKPRAYTPDVEEYKKFLECGLEKFKKENKK